MFKSFAPHMTDSYEAIDRCDLFARMTEDNLLSHPAVQANAAAREFYGQHAAGEGKEETELNYEGE